MRMFLLWPFMGITWMDEGKIELVFNFGLEIFLQLNQFEQLQITTQNAECQWEQCMWCNYLMCSLTDGFSYEREAMESWINTPNRSSPMTCLYKPRCWPPTEAWRRPYSAGRAATEHSLPELKTACTGGWVSYIHSKYQNKASKGCFHSDAIEEPFLVLQRAYQWTVLKRTIFPNVKNILII